MYVELFSQPFFMNESGIIKNGQYQYYLINGCLKMPQIQVVLRYAKNGFIFLTWIGVCSV